MTPRAAHRSQAGPIHIPVYRDRPLKVCAAMSAGGFIEFGCGPSTCHSGNALTLSQA